MAYFPMSMPRHSKAHYWDKPASLFLYVRSSLTAAVPISRFYTNYAQRGLISLVYQVTASFPGHLPFSGCDPRQVSVTKPHATRHPPPAQGAGDCCPDNGRQRPFLHPASLIAYSPTEWRCAIQCSAASIRHPPGRQQR